MGLHQDYAPVHIDGHLMVISYTYGAPETAIAPAESFAVAVSLEPGAQVEASAGPVANLAFMLAAIDDFDAELERIMRPQGRPVHLVGRGYDTVATRPEDVKLIPKERCQIMDDYLPRHGKCARVMMRCSTATQVSMATSTSPRPWCSRRSPPCGGPSSALPSTTRPCGAVSPPRAWYAVRSGTSLTPVAAAPSPAALTTISRLSATAPGYPRFTPSS